jgi:hypothetical protein
MTAKKFILPDHLVWVVVGDMNKVEAGIRELNLGEIHKIDADGDLTQYVVYLIVNINPLKGGLSCVYKNNDHGGGK